MPAPSLVDLSTRACIKNIRSLTDVGDFEFWKIKTVLARVDSPEQLHRIELASPQIQGEDAELWQTLIRKHIPNWQEKNYAPKNPKKWYEVYCKYKKEQQRKIAEDEEILRNRMMGIKKQKDSMVSKVVDLRNLPKVPRDPRMIANNGGVPLKGKSLFRQEKPSGLNWTSGSKTKMTDGKSVLTRARREAKEIARMSKLSTPTHQLVGRKSQVLKAPAGMAGEYARAAQPAVRILAGKQRKSISSTYSGGISGPNLEERENRLRALTMSATVKPTMVGSSDDEDDFIDDDEADDLFDEKPAPPSRKNTAHRPGPSSSPPVMKPSDFDRKRQASPPSRTGTASPAPAMKPMMPRKRAPVDVFNRTAKKPRR